VKDNTILCPSCHEVAYVVYLRATDKIRPWTAFVTVGSADGPFAYVDETPHCYHCDHILADSWTDVPEIWPIV
jgi:hypothetical protein